MDQDLINFSHGKDLASLAFLPVSVSVYIFYTLPFIHISLCTGVI